MHHSYHYKELIFDFETNPYYGAFYTEKKQLEQKKWSPIRS